MTLKELEKEMPKKMSEAETKVFIENILATESMNKGMLMKTLKSNANIEMAIALETCIFSVSLSAIPSLKFLLPLFLPSNVNVDGV
mgnify:CR=1 FL=1